MHRAGLLFGLALAACRTEEPARQREELALLTSLPIVFGETFTLDAPPSPLLAALEKEFSVRPVDGPEQLPAGGRLLAIQPQALTAERLVALDRWVRLGGRLVLLADPQLRWESQRPLGDRFRPPYAFPDTGLLAHWGLQLEPPALKASGEERRLPGGTVKVSSPGRLIARGANCQVQPDGFVATCRLGRGSALIVADADWVMADDGPEQLSGLLAAK